MIDSTNQLKGQYNKGFLTRQLNEAVKGIPKENRQDLADLIESRAKLLGCSNEDALQKALKALRR